MDHWADVLKTAAPAAKVRGMPDSGFFLDTQHGPAYHSNMQVRTCFARAASVVPRHSWTLRLVACGTGRLRVHAGRGSGVVGLALPLLGVRLLTFVPGVFASPFFCVVPVALACSGFSPT